MVQKLRNLKDYEGPTLNQTSSDTAVTIDVQLLAESVYSSARSCIKDKPRGAGSAKELALRDDLLENLSIFSDQLHQSDYKSVLVAAATIKCKLGAIQFAKNEYMAASSSFKKAFEIRRIVFGDSNFDTITAAFETGKCLHCLGNTVQALHYYKVLVKVLSSVFFQESEYCRSDIVNKDSIVMIHSIAWVFHQEKSFKHASTFYRLALRIARKVITDYR
jgi:tetratricopeptide (TPR) repeat protein